MPKREPLPDVSSADTAPLGQVGDYRLIELLGKGGMGQVYKARHMQLDRVEAVKVLSRELIGDEKAVARFQREMRAVARLDHPHIVRAYNALEVEGNYLLVMEYVAGLNLAQVLEQLRRLPIADACELIRQAALGLQCAHEHEMVHRDIKPSNLMLSPAGQVKILDLGLARVGTTGPADKSVTSTGLVMGTPDYIPPEQVKESHTVDIRADLYSLGCTLFALLCGRPPYGGEEHGTAYEKLTAHVEQVPPDVRTLRAEIPGELASIVSRMLAKDPNQRFATPKEVAAELQPFSVGSDCVRLLARASRGPGGDDTEGESDANLATIRAADTGPAASLTVKSHDPQPTSAGRGWWKGAVAAAVVSLLVGVGIWAFVARPWQAKGDRAASTIPDTNLPHVATGGVPSRLPGTDVPAVGPTSRIVLSWAPPSEPLGLWLLSPDGEERSCLTGDDDMLDTEPVFSPDARRIAFVRSRRGISRKSNLWVYDLEGGRCRQLVAARGDSERLMSPVWLSNERILYTRNPALAETSNIEVWQVSVDDVPAPRGSMPAPELVFRFRDKSSDQVGLVADVAPDGNQLLLVACRSGDLAGSDVFISDLEGNRIATVWEDQPSEFRDSRALWSRVGGQIAWQHQTGPDSVGVGWADRGDDGNWNARLQPAGLAPVVMPVAWNPNGKELMCVRIYGTSLESSRAAFFLVDKDFEVTERRFELPGGRSMAVQRHSGRLGDWALIPPDVSLPLPDE